MSSSADRERRTEDIFTRARDLPHSDRASFLRDECAGDETLYGEVKQRVDAHDAVADALPGQGQSSTHGLLMKRLSAHAPKTWRYELIEEVARGGMGAVLKVWDEDLRRTLAMKVMLASVDDADDDSEIDDHTLGRMLEEAQVTGQLDHPGIVPVHELGVDQNGQVYFTMPLVKGRTLVDIFQLVHREEEGWTRTRALELILKVCDAMSYAHSKGVLHRDLKPANVMVGRFGEVYVMDWGVAKVIGKEDTRDLRIKTAMTTATLMTERTEGVKEGPDTPLVTMDGMVVGTPSYMPIEQARGEIDKVDVRSDVYSIGAMMYHLLAGQMPYVPEGMMPSAHAVWMWVVEQPPQPLHQIAPDVPAKLLAICEKAMSREQADRYQDAARLADDLRAYIEGRVVRAYETGAWAEARKWIKRNKQLAAAIAAAILLALGGTTGMSVIQAAGKRAANVEKEKVMRLSAVRRLEQLIEEADSELWPVQPDQSKKYEDWRARANQVIAEMYPSDDGEDIGHLARLEEVRSRATPLTEEEREARRKVHPSSARLAELRLRFASLEYAQNVREGKQESIRAKLDPTQLAGGALAVNDRAWPLVARRRETFGREPEGLALARFAADQMVNDDLEDIDRARIMNTLAHAYFANGMNEETLSASQESARLAPPYAEEYRQFEEVMADAVRGVQGVNGRRLLAERAAEIAEIEARINSDASWAFENADDEWWHTQLTQLIAGIEALRDPVRGLLDGASQVHGWGIERRMAWLIDIANRSAEVDWSAEQSVIDKDPRYDGLVLGAQADLLPLGPDPVTGFREYAHLVTGNAPARTEDGELILEEDTAMVLVLLPGGSFTMGAQRGDRIGLNFSEDAMISEFPVHEVTLSPFLVSKFEMTQAQWLFFTSFNPSARPPEKYDASWNRDERRATLLHPVEQVDWFTATEISRRLGLGLPTEAQWEYAARAGSGAPWSSGTDRTLLVDHANLADQFLLSIGDRSNAESWDDGHALASPVGTYLPNGFGLHDVHGNVFEWCVDGFEGTFYWRTSKVDPVRAPESGFDRVIRGGGHRSLAASARSSTRGRNAPNTAGPATGLRPVRNL